MIGSRLINAMKTRSLLRELSRLAMVYGLLLPTCSEVLAQLKTDESVNAQTAVSSDKSEQTSLNPSRTLAVYTSPWIDEVLKLTQAGVEQGIILAYVDSSGTFNLGSQEIISLRDKGVADAVITAILEHDAAYVSGTRKNPP